MELSKSLCSEKQCSCFSNGFKYIATCGDCRKTECHNCVTIELFEEEEVNIKDESGNDIFDNSFG